MSFEPDICIYHGNCDDGFGAAMAVWKRWPNVEFVPGIYGEDPPFDRCNDKRVLMVDFSYKKPVLERLMSYARDITILDHHKTAQADLETETNQLASLAPVPNRSICLRYLNEKVHCRTIGTAPTATCLLAAGTWPTTGLRGDFGLFLFLPTFEPP